MATTTAKAKKNTSSFFIIIFVTSSPFMLHCSIVTESIANWPKILFQSRKNLCLV
jgi:hypothetical protein